MLVIFTTVRESSEVNVRFSWNLIGTLKLFVEWFIGQLNDFLSNIPDSKNKQKHVKHVWIYKTCDKLFVIAMMKGLFFWFGRETFTCFYWCVILNYHMYVMHQKYWCDFS